MKTALLILSAILLLSLAGNWLQWREAKNMENYRMAENLNFQAAIESARGTAASYADSAHHLKVRVALTRDSAKVAVNALRSKIAVLTGKIRQQAPPTAQEDTVCLRFIVAGMQKDTVIQDQGNLIVMLERQQATQYDDFNKIIGFQDAQIVEEKNVSMMLEGQRDNYQALYLKAKKKADKRFSIGPTAGYGIGNSGLTPFVGVGITYSLLRF